MAALLSAKAAADPPGWRAFQATVSDLKARRSRAEGEAGAVRAALEAAAAEQRAAERRGALVGDGGEASSPAPRTTAARVVVVTGFEAFNARLYEQAAADAAAARPGLEVSVFSDADISGPRRGELDAALATADAFFGSLLFDYDQVRRGGRASDGCGRKRARRSPSSFPFRTHREWWRSRRGPVLRLSRPRPRRAETRSLAPRASHTAKERMAG